MSGKKKKIAFFLAAVFLGTAQTSFCLADEYIQVAALMDLRTQFSDGAYSLNQLISLARERGFNVLFINDHDRMAMAYGVWPLQNILMKKIERPSINRAGAEKYLEMIESASKRFPDMILIPGAESAPFYYWEGSYFTKNLTVCDWERHLILVGLDKPEDYRDLPILHNGYSTKYIRQSISASLFFFLVPLAFGFYMLKRPGKIRYLGVAFLVFAILLVINNHPFRSSPYNQYHGSQGIAPYQAVIDYVNSRGGLSFWNHPESLSGLGDIGPASKKTLPYPEVLAESKYYSGFSSLYGDTITITEPGNIWDQVLMEYCSGVREKPVWGISAADFHEEGEAGERLGNFPTIFLVKDKTKESILDALRKGRLYAFRGLGDGTRLVLEDFSVSDSKTLQNGIQGEEVSITGYPTIHFIVSTEGSTEKNPLTIRLIRSGKLIKTFSGETLTNVDFIDDFNDPGQKIYYRLDAEDGKGRKLVSNPIFIKFLSGKD